MQKEIEDLLKDKLPGSTVEVCDLSGSEDHLGITVTSELFSGKDLLEQHRIVMDILRPRLKTDLHAIKLKTIVP